MQLQQIVSVLTMYPLEGINRKVQLRPLEWEGEPGSERVVKAHLILKWGGELTSYGRDLVSTSRQAGYGEALVIIKRNMV